MVNRKGAGKGAGRGYKNLRGFPKDPKVHQDSAKGKKQPQKLDYIPYAKKPKRHDTIENIMAWEDGTLSSEDTAKMFADLIKYDKIPSLQGIYGRREKRYIDAGIITPEGEIVSSTQPVGDDDFEDDDIRQTVTDAQERVQRRVRIRNPVYNNVSIGRAFFRGERGGHTSNQNIKIVDTPHETLLVGYGWAVYGARDKASGEVTFYQGWKGYSRSTSKQLSQTGLRADSDIVLEERRELN